MALDQEAQGCRSHRSPPWACKGHDKMDWPTVEQQADTIEAFAALGVKVYITEFDVDVLPQPPQQNSADISAQRPAARPSSIPTPTDCRTTMQQALASATPICSASSSSTAAPSSRITFWGVTDGDSWLNDFPVRGRTNYPLLFDRDGKPKPAFDAVVQRRRKPQE